jgi:hypothetical protein
MSKNAIIAVWVVIILVVAGVFVMTMNQQAVPVSEQNGNPSPAPTPSPTGKEEPPTGITLPVKADHPLVSQSEQSRNPGFWQYFFSGTIAQVLPVAGGTRVVLRGADATVPEMVIPSDVQVQQIANNTGAVQYVPATALKAGQLVDIRMEYQFDGSRWLLREVFLPLERNS